MSIIEKVFGTHSERELKRIEPIVKKIESYREEMGKLTDEELRGKTMEFKKRVAEGTSLDDILPEAYAVVREGAKRVLNQEHYRVQLIGGIVLHQGRIAEMRTGEGKTQTALLPAYLNALEGKGVHVVTVNDYLAKRDAEWMGQVHEFLGLKVGVVLNDMKPDERREAYNCDITYVTNNELGFDYLRDNMVIYKEQLVLRDLHYAIIDEVDSVLIDEARTPLIISGGAKKTANLYLQADAFAKRLKGDDFEIDEKTRQIMLSEKGVSVAERYFKIKNLYDVDHTQLVHHITQALKANYIMKNEVEYVVQDDEIVIVDQFTGRTMPGRAYSDGLHQAIEAKEGVSIKEETSTLATITYQNFFRLYDKLAGMTGTAKTEEEEFLDIYNMRVIEIPTNRPVQRIDYPDAIFANPRLKFAALVKEVKELYEKGQPVLVGTISVETSELVHELLRKERIPHEVLNAKNHAREAEIIAKAGRPKSVTIATNMAGRGTDIKLTDESRALGGLVVLGSERHESRRIDNQLRGRSGRQGDPGYSRFYVSLKDELMIRFGGDKFEKLFESMGDAQIESKMVTKSISQAQKRVEGYNYDVRKQLLDYDDVLRKQREIMYEQRNFVLENEDVHGIVRDMIDRVIDSVVDANVDHTRHDESVDYAGVLQGLELLGLEEKDNLKLEEIQGKEKNDVTTYCAEKIFTLYDDKIKDIRDEFKQFEKTIVLRNMDRNWIEHIDMMDKLRNGIHLRSYAQNNPLQAYIQEGYEMFEEMQARIAREVVFFALKVQVERKVEN